METLLADLANARKDTLTLLEQLTDEQLLLPISGALWADGSMGGVLMTNAQHENQHLGWIEEGLRS
jgi:hypothetical protein